MDVTYGADYSAGELSPAELDRFTAYDLRFLFRYIGWPDNPKCISHYPGAYRALADSGRIVLPAVEEGKTDPAVVIGRKGVRAADQLGPVIVRGEAAVQAATEAIAGQIGGVAQRLAASIDIEISKSPTSPTLPLESVAVSFGVTPISGVQAMFTAQAGSSAQVTITLSRQPSDRDSS